MLGLGRLAWTCRDVAAAATYCCFLDAACWVRMLFIGRGHAFSYLALPYISTHTIESHGIHTERYGTSDTIGYRQDKTGQDMPGRILDSPGPETCFPKKLNQPTTHATG
jgi:hypothetical protein